MRVRSVLLLLLILLSFTMAAAMACASHATLSHGASSPSSNPGHCAHGTVAADTVDLDCSACHANCMATLPDGPPALPTGPATRLLARAAPSLPSPWQAPPERPQWRRQAGALWQART